MKERIVVDNRIYLNKEDFIEVEDMITDNLTTAKYTKEQVPENFAELKELVNKYSGKIDRQVSGITVGTTRIMIMMKFDNIYFGKNGNIYFADKYLGTYTPERQWQIIKSLIEE